MPVLQIKYWVVAFFIICQTLAGIIGGLVFASTPRENVIFPGVFIRDVEVGGLSRDQAVGILQRDLAKKLKAEKLTLRYGEKSWNTSYEELGVKFDIDATVEKALEVGRGDNKIKESLAMFRVRYRKPVLPLEYTLDEKKFNSFLNKIAAEIYVPEKNAGVIVSGGRVKIEPAVTGIKLDLTSNANKIRKHLGEIHTSPFDLEALEIKPLVTEKDLQGIQDLLATGVTTFARSDKARSKAINAGVEALDGRILRPGEVFSFNGALGKDLEENEYRNALLIGSGRLSENSSGGTTQVATTLYQAALYAGMKIIDRHSHLVPPRYAKLGQDAAVAYGKLDLKIENSTGHPVYIQAKVQGSRVLISLLGVKKKGMTIQVSTRETLTKQPELTGPKGSHAKVFRIYYENGVEVHREVVSEEDYM